MAGTGGVWKNKSYNNIEDVNLDIESITEDEKNLLDFIKSNGYTNNNNGN